MVERPLHDSVVRMGKVVSTVVATWPVGTFVENLVVRQDGNLVLSVLSERELVWCTPSGQLGTFARFPAPPTGMSLYGETLFVNVGEPGAAGWAVYRVEPDGRAAKLAELTEARFLNGSTVFRGTHLLVVDSILGQVIAIDVRTGSTAVWLDDERLHKQTDEPMMPGVNGIKAYGRGVYLTSTERSLILRASVTPEGNCSGLEILAERLVGDDLALDVHGNVYIATHVYNQVLCLASDGTRVVLADEAEGSHGSTAVAFGRGHGDRRALYVTTTGGLVAPVDGVAREAKLLRLEVGVAGEPLEP